MKNVKRIIAATVASAMIFGMTACSALGGGKAQEEVEGVVESYMENVISGKYSKAAKVVVDGEDDFAEADLDDDYMMVINAMCAASEYEIVETEVNKDSAKCTLEITTPRLGSVEDNAASAKAEDIAAAMSDAETLEAEVTLKLTNDDGEWLIKNSSEVTSLYLDTVGSMTFSAFSELAALEYIDNLYNALETGDLESIYNVMASDNYDSYEEFLDSAQMDNPAFAAMLQVVASLEHTSVIVDSGEDYADIMVEGTMPDPGAIFNDALDMETFAIIVAYQMFAPDRVSEAYDIFSERMIAEIPNHTETVDVYWVHHVTLDENGEFTQDTIDESENPFDEMEFDQSRFEGQEAQLMAIALTYALENGLCTEEDLAAYTGSVAPEGTGSIDVERGSDFFGIWFYTDETFTTTVDCYTTSMTGFFVVFQTTNYYDAGATFTVRLEKVGSDYVYEDTSSATVDGQDVGHIGIFASSVGTGTYIMTITGYNGEVFATITFVINE